MVVVFTIIIGMTTTAILSWIWANIFKLGLIMILVTYIKTILHIFVLQPLQGHDKKTSMDELAKYVILLLLCGALYINGTRETEWAPYSDATIAALIAGVFSIAAIKPVTGIFKSKDDKDKITPIE